MKYIHLIALPILFLIFGAAGFHESEISAQDLSGILAILISPQSPLDNLRQNLSQELQVSLPQVKGSLPKTIGNVKLSPFENDKPGLRLKIKIITLSPEKVKLRAHINFYDPKRGPSNMGAQWKDLIFQKQNGTWFLFQDLGGAIK